MGRPSATGGKCQNFVCEARADSSTVPPLAPLGPEASGAVVNGGSEFAHNEAFSFQIATDNQEETDRYWNAIVGNDGQESRCGWCKDKWGLSWQITPRVLSDALGDPDRAAAKRAMQAMFSMRKIDIATIEAARAGIQA